MDSLVVVVALMPPLTFLAIPCLSTEERVWLVSHPTLRIDFYREATAAVVIESMQTGVLGTYVFVASAALSTETFRR